MGVVWERWETMLGYFLARFDSENPPTYLFSYPDLFLGLNSFSLLIQSNKHIDDGKVARIGGKTIPVSNFSFSSSLDYSYFCLNFLIKFYRGNLT